MVAIHQFIPSYTPRDAVGTHSRHVGAILRGLGFESEIYVAEARGVARGEVRYFRDFRGATNGEPTWLLYQYSTGSPMVDYLRARPEAKLVNYHNVTPPEFFEGWEPMIVPELAEGRRQIGELAHVCDLAIADSTYNAADLAGAGYPRTEVVPILLDLDAMSSEVDEAAEEKLRAAKNGGGADWLFVGRICPNKAQHEVVKSFAAYRRMYDPRARLHLLGTSSSHSYWTALRDFVDALGLTDAVILHGSVSDGQKTAFFRTADAFVCLSDHEGFCVPVVEAMHHGLPVVAFAAAAVPETVADGGLLLQTKDPVVVAAAVHRVVSDDVVRSALVSNGRARAAEFDLVHTRRLFEDVIRDVVEA